MVTHKAWVSVAGMMAMLCTVAWAETSLLPEGVKLKWDLDKAVKLSTPSREQICINGLWRWQPSEGDTSQIPDGDWGYFKVPGSWPGIENWIHKDCQTVYAHPNWQSEQLRDVSCAWYQREITIPREWSGRRVVVSTEYLNSFATVFVDGNKVGEMRFPRGEVELTSVCQPGGRYLLSLQVTAMPLKAVMMSFSDTASARKVKGSVEHRGLCGDVWLLSTPPGERIVDVKIEPSVREGELGIRAELEGLNARTSYALKAIVRDASGRPVKEFTSQLFKGGDPKDGHMAFTEKWETARLWDLNTPKNQYSLQLSLLDGEGLAADTYLPVRFGFRELWIDGRDIYLNGTRIFLSAVPLDNAQLGAAWSTYEAARESLLRLMIYGVNFVYLHNYDCTPGAHLSVEEILRAADDVGILVALTQPHFGHYEWDAADADEQNGYAQHAAFYVHVAQNHPSVVFYSTSHNSTTDSEDMNPDLVGRDYRAVGDWALKNREKASRAEAIIRRLDPTRVVYHHSGGNFGAMHTINFYTNWVPAQEMSDWFGRWSKEGIKPVFTCEYGVPESWDWAMYRGWYKGERAFGDANVPWEFCLAEWNSQFIGDKAFQISEMEKRNLRWEAREFKAGHVWHRWDYPHALGSNDFPERDPIFAMYLRDVWRAHRTWGLSGMNFWDNSLLYRLRPGLARNIRRDLETDWEQLQRPGFSPDFLEQRNERMDLAYDREDWIPTEAGMALLRNNQPLLAYIGGKSDVFTSKDHNLVAGETVEKQIIIINNSRETVTCDCDWNFALPHPVGGSKQVSVKTGDQARIPLRFEVLAGTATGAYELNVSVKFSTGEVQKDAFIVHVMAPPAVPVMSGKVALFDPKGETKGLLDGLKIAFQSVDAKADLSAYDTLVVGKEALTVDGPGPDLSRVRDGLKVIVFEQSPEVLQHRLGFRVAAYGLRKVFRRVPDHPLLAGLDADSLGDWRGESTILPPRLTSDKNRGDNYGRIYEWCGIAVTRLYRCGNRGSVASSLIEKPARGDFLPVIDGGFSLQYAPLLEYREGQGIILFCQMDVTGRTESDPAAETLVANIMNYVRAWQPAPRREVVYAGDTVGRKYLESVGLRVSDCDGTALKPDQLLVVGPEGGTALTAGKDAVAVFLEAGGKLLALGVTEADARAVLPFGVTLRETEHINAYFEAPGCNSPLEGIGPADVHCRAPRDLPLVTGGAKSVGDGVLATSEDGRVVFCQMAPWQFDYQSNYGVKRTFRRAAYLVNRLLGSLGADTATPLTARFSQPVGKGETRWSDGLYLDQPEEMDDPYRFFRW